MAIATLTCVGCGKAFQGDRDLLPEFTTSSGRAGGDMCQECFNRTNALNNANGKLPIPTPPAGAWGS